MKLNVIAKIITFGLIIPAMFGASLVAVKAYYSPLGDGLQMPTVAVGTSDMQVIPTATAITIAALAQESVCGESGVWNVLVLGTDSVEMRGNPGADFVRMMRVDFPNRQVTLFAFPPDLWVDTSTLGLTNPTIQSTYLGMVFHEARLRSTHTILRDVMLDGTNASATMLFNNFTITTNYYLTVDLSQVPMMVDAIGGVPLNVPQTITDPWIGTIIPSGPQTLNGTQFIAYARAIPDSDFARIQRNDLLMEALREKLLDPTVWGQIPQLYSQFNGMIATNFSPEQINHLSCLLKQVPLNAIVKERIKQEWTSPGPMPDSLYWDKTQVLNQLKTLNFIP
ncbi:MAG TPA: LCP family protein [Anaerolineales bacterium]|nr:LCP family protein [Anaerolineales bacterium]HLO31318.1 LCP family protein [Anaerolineales bacterium]